MDNLALMIISIFLFVFSAYLSEDNSSTLGSFIGSLIIVGLLFSISEYMFGFISIVSVFIVSNPAVFIGFIFLYFIIGGLYVLLWRYGRFIRDDSELIKKDFDEKKLKYDGYSVEDYLISRDYVQNYGPMNNKWRIFKWIMLWPLSVVGNITRRPVVAITTFIYNQIFNSLKNIAKRVGRKIINGK